MPELESPPLDAAQLAADSVNEAARFGAYLSTDPVQALFSHRAGRPTPTVDIVSDHLPGFFRHVPEMDSVEFRNYTHGIGTITGMDTFIHLHAAEAGIGPPDARSAIAVMSGVCLWGHGEVYGLAGTQDKPIDLRLNLIGIKTKPTEVRTYDGHPYAQEAVARLAGFIARLRDYSESNGRKMDSKAVIHVPYTEYKLPMVAMQQRGNVSTDFLRKYFEVVDQKYEEMRDRVRAEFAHHELPQPTFVSPLSEELKEVDIVNDMHDLTFIQGYFETPETYASSILAMLQFSKLRSTDLPVIVDTVTEHAYFDEAAKNHTFKALGLYPLPLFLSSDVLFPMSRDSQMLYSEQVRTIWPWRYERIV